MNESAQQSPEQTWYCVCGHPLPENSPPPPHMVSERKAIQVRLRTITQRKAEILKELGSLTIEEERLRSHLTHLNFINPSF